MKGPPAIIVGIDLGNKSFKAVRLQKKGAQYALTRAAILPSPRNPTDAALPTEQAVSSQIKEIASLMKSSGAEVHMTVNSPNSAIRYVELPNMPLEDIRAALKLNSAAYLRQNFENYTFDISSLDAEGDAVLMSKIRKVKHAAAAHGKIKALVGGIATAEIILYFHAARRAGLRPKSLQLAPVSLINAFAGAHPEIMSAQAVGLLDIGFLSSCITILERGKPILTRAVPIGGKHITDYIASNTSSSFEKAEAAKMQDDAALREAMTRTCSTLIREVRGSINFFEKNSELAVQKIHLSGASTVSPAVQETLGHDIGLGCETWNAAAGLLMELPVEQQDLFSKNQVAFATAIGAALSPTGSVLSTPAAPSAAGAKAALSGSSSSLPKAPTAIKTP